MIHVCSLARLHETVEDTGARHVVSLIGDEASIERPVAIVPENHLWLRLHDISSPLDGYILPDEDARRRPVGFRASLGPARAAGRALLRRHQPLDRERVRQRLRAQPASRRREYRASAAARLADGDAEHPHRVARRPPARPRRPHDRGDRNHRPRRLPRKPARRSGSIWISRAPEWTRFSENPTAV